MKIELRAAGLAIVLATSAASAKPAANGGIVFPKGTQIQAAYSGDAYIKLKPEEQVAYLMMWSIHQLENRCHDELDRFCKLDELVRGVPGKHKRIIGLKVDPARDANYRYSVDVTSDYKTSVEPRHAGIGGFLDDQGSMGGIYFNPDGAATRQSKELQSNGWGVGPGGEGGDYQR
jgi:hypothetical protein